MYKCSQQTISHSTILEGVGSGGNSFRQNSIMNNNNLSSRPRYYLDENQTGIRSNKTVALNMTDNRKIIRREYSRDFQIST
jgi:hypothetical protein